MYKIIRYDTVRGGGVAFIDYQANDKLALDCVFRGIEHNHPINKVEIVGFCKTLKTEKLKCATEYETFDEKEFIFMSFKLPYPVYYNGGDCC